MLFEMLLLGAVLTALLIAFTVYTVNLKDVYYGYGRAVAMIHFAGMKVKVDDAGGLRFKHPQSCREEIYIGHLAEAVTILLVKNKIVPASHLKKIR